MLAMYHQFVVKPLLTADMYIYIPNSEYEKQKPFSFTAGNN